MLIVLIVTAVGVPGAAQPSGPRASPEGFLPDLVVSLFELLNPPRPAGDRMEMAVGIGVRNQGRARAGEFKVGIEYRHARPPTPATPRERGPRTDALLGPYYVAFTISGSSPTWGPLDPGETAYRKGEVALPATLRGVTILVRALADDCHGEILAFSYCRVRENREDNNASSQITVEVP